MNFNFRDSINLKNDLNALFPKEDKGAKKDKEQNNKIQ